MSRRCSRQSGTDGLIHREIDPEIQIDKGDFHRYAIYGIPEKPPTSVLPRTAQGVRVYCMSPVGYTVHSGRPDIHLNREAMR